MTMRVSAYTLAERFIGTKEAPGAANNPHVLAMLRLDAAWVAGDDVPWCSAFANYIAWLLRLPRSKSLAARSWLTVGTPIALEQAVPGFDIVVLKRGAGPQPGPEVTRGAAGHVGFFAGLEGDLIHILGGNQGDAVSVQAFQRADVLGVRRLYAV